MVPTAPPRLAWIEACRGIAATSVVLYHVARHLDANYGMPWLKSAFQFGHAGVDLFFVISGFIILFVHFDDVGRSECIQRYLGRRFTRVLPIYWLALGLTIARRWAGGHGTPLGDIAWAILPLPISADPVLGVAWTLQYEFVFYAAFGVLLLNRAAGVATMAAWLALVAICMTWGGRIAVPEAYWGSFNLEFFAGMAIAYWLRGGRVRQYRFVPGAGIILLLIACLTEDLGWFDGYGRFARLAYGVPSALIVLGGAEASRHGVSRVPFILRTVGAASYSIYLFHFMAIGMAWQLWLATGLARMVTPEVTFVVFSSGAIAVGVMISRLIEYPLMGLIRGAFINRRMRKTVGIKPDVLY